jgi:hypothetical protein
MFGHLYRISQQSHLSCTPPIYRPLLAVPVSRLIYETSLSASIGINRSDLTLSS